MRSRELLLCEHTRLKECQYEPGHLRVTDPSTQSNHHRVMIDVVEAPLDIPFDGPLIREPSFGRPWPQELSQLLASKKLD